MSLAHRKREPWWTWHWDRCEAGEFPMTIERCIRWRRGSLLTIYFFKWRDGGWQVWLYGPFNLAIGVGHG